MSSQWVAFLVVAAMLPGEAAPAGSSQPSMESPLSVSREPSEGYELRDAVRSAFRQWAKPSDDDAPQAAREFLTLYQDLQADTQLARSQRETLRTQVRNRLIQLSEQISSRIARQRRLAKVERPKSVARPPDKAAPLAQHMGGLGGVGRGGANAGAAFGGGGVSRQATLPDAGKISST